MNRGDVVEVIKITGSHYSIPGAEVQLDPSVETLSGLSKVCYTCCYEILTRDEAIVGSTIGYLSQAAMQEIEKSLKTVLDIP
jgi:mRNA-degrading endonuclease toxin of MazEF toxin-antitoxin module